MQTSLNVRAHLTSFRESRDSWIEILLKNPDNVTAAQHILAINNKIELLNTLRILSGDFDPID